MRLLRRNTQKIYYATFAGQTEIQDEYENATGQYKTTYSNPVALNANVSASRGTSDVDMFGISLHYDKTIVTDRDCPISETSILWVDTVPTLAQDGTTQTPHDYIVKRVARSLNSTTYAIERVNVSYVEEGEGE
jgi:hypothetical protein